MFFVKNLKSLISNFKININNIGGDCRLIYDSVLNKNKTDESKNMKNNINWEHNLADGWYFNDFEPNAYKKHDRPNDILWDIDENIPSKHYVCEFYWQERGMALWGEYFYSKEEAIVWAYENFLI